MHMSFPSPSHHESGSPKPPGTDAFNSFDSLPRSTTSFFAAPATLPSLTSSGNLLLDPEAPSDSVKVHGSTGPSSGGESEASAGQRAACKETQAEVHALVVDRVHAILKGTEPVIGITVRSSQVRPLRLRDCFLPSKILIGTRIVLMFLSQLSNVRRGLFTPHIILPPFFVPSLLTFSFILSGPAIKHQCN